ncbi:MAG: helix-turn-helix transcriptional regulator [Pseudomonadota bacterium]
MTQSRRAKSAKHRRYLKRLGAHIKKVRKERGYSTDRLYLEAGFSRANMSRIESGSVDVQAWTLKRIADTIGVSVSRLFDFE